MQAWTHEQQQEVETELLRIADMLLPHIQPAAIHANLEGQTDSTTLFNGSAGIILFYLRLYEHYREPQYLQVCEAATVALLQHPSIVQPAYFILYTGATGLLYLCVKMYEATGNAAYMGRALDLLPYFEQGILEHVTQDDLLSGHAGNIWILTYLHAHTKNERLPELIRKLIDKMIQHARIAPQGLRWGHIKKSYDCLAGFSHGASGIAYALLQTAQYFRDEGLRYLAEEALRYEMQYYDPATANWLDLRLTSTRLYESDIMEWQVSDFRKYASDVNSWAHGAAGIGLARLYAWQVTQQDAYLQQAQTAVQRCLRDARELKRGDFTLCSGYGGVAAFLQQAAAVLQQPALRMAAQQLALAAVRYYRQHGVYNEYIPGNNADPGLFSGMAGVGYMLLGALMPCRADVVTHPLICADSRFHTAPLYAPGEVKRQLFARYYKNTFLHLQQHGADIAALCAAADIHALTAQLPQAIAALPPEQRIIAQDCFLFEQSFTEMWVQHKGWLCYEKRRELLHASAQQLLQLPATDFLQTVFIPVHNARLCRAPDSSSYYYLLYSHEAGISAFPAGRLTATLFSTLATGKKLQTVMDETLYAHFAQAGEEERIQVQEAIIAQTRMLLQQCFIKGE
ncbi:lanthionine synthetase LanC family protein [Chitinophaga japonensis]|uniref:Lanthionine synthetase-like protein n=1 Tax=Chitinophaga japonensis TaxID=104662 RepID=A0A562SSK4_CHIJA|nr:lanthionine synthetase LanC family protein [Chitinophaga japonensis]TWI84192.1 lanthionine synthetase-like protein [Chitinophaga japonensis]